MALQYLLQADRLAETISVPSAREDKIMKLEAFVLLLELAFDDPQRIACLCMVHDSSAVVCVASLDRRPLRT